MALTKTRLELLENIQGKLVRGDIKEIAKNTGLTREYVSKVLSTDTNTYNEEIVNEAVRIIAFREQITKNLLKKLTVA